jgi:hypothetical protein
MCDLYSITTNQAAIIALFRVINRYFGNLAPMPGVFPDYSAPVIRNTDKAPRWSPCAGACRLHHVQAACQSPTSATLPRRIGAVG